jgi:hypothetical protein
MEEMREGVMVDWLSASPCILVEPGTGAGMTIPSVQRPIRQARFLVTQRRSLC